MLTSGIPSAVLPAKVVVVTRQSNCHLIIDQELRDRGVAKEDIILGFRSPSVRALLAQAIA